METEIIPAIIEDTWQATEEKLKRLEGKSKWVHLDASDGVFTAHSTWSNPVDLESFDSELSIEAHLMIKNPEKIIDSWLVEPVTRIIFHIEAVTDSQMASQIIKTIKDGGREAVVAINPGTAQLAIKPLLDDIDGVLVMGVDPGWSGAEFKPETAHKVKALRELWPDGIIETDGGINDERASSLVAAGADRLVSSSFVWSFGDPAEGIKKLIESI